jgi:hypothetical protein
MKKNTMKCMLVGAAGAVAVFWGMQGVVLAGPLPTDAGRQAGDTVTLTSNAVYHVTFTGARMVTVINNSAEEIRVGLNHPSTNSFVTSLANTGAVKVVAWGIYTTPGVGDSVKYWSLSMIGPTNATAPATWGAE